MAWFSRRAKVAAAQMAVKYAGVMVGMGRANWLDRSYRLLAAEGFQNNPVVYACVTKLAKAVASVDLQLYDHKRQGKLRRIDKHDILDLVNNPNPMWSGRQFREKLATHYLIGGNSYVLANNGPDRPPGELWLLPPEYVTVDAANGRMLPAGYRYRPNGQEIVYPIDQVTGRSAVCHLRTVNPLDDWYGMPPMAAAAHGIDVFNAGQEWNKALLQNEGRPSGALQMRQNKDGTTPVLTNDQFVRLKEEIDVSYSGAHNAGRPILLDGSLDWVQMSMSSKDMDHRETMLTNARFIAACYGTPPQLVNIPGESTFSNYGQATLSYWSDTVLPLLGLLLEDVNRWLPALMGEPKAFLWYDEEQIPALEPRRKEKSDRINAADYMTPDEKREAMGLEAYVPPASPGAQSLFVDARKIPIDLAGTVDPNLHPALVGDEPTKPEEPTAPKN
ncbi:MAG: phage portal protein [Isosphaeraceae bacterium]